VALALGLAGCASPLAGVRAAFEHSQRGQVFQPARYPEGNWDPAGFEFEDAWFTAADGTRLNGWYCHVDKPAAALLFAHGATGNLSRHASLLRSLRDRHRVATLVFDYRGCGKSDGEPDERGILDDARAARAWLARRANVAENDVVLMGQSLGGALSVELAAADGARGLILVDMITSLRELASQKIALLPAWLTTRDGLDTTAQLGKYRGALLQIHGDADRIVPLARAQKLFAAANEPKRLLVRRGGDHDGPPLWDEEGAAIDAFLSSLPAVRQLPPPARWHKAGAGG
jgi:fermentation-respiration switch protein FrsA (DUF1100 family)